MTTADAGSGRVICASLAPSLDRYGYVRDMWIGEISRPESITVLAGGKGLNAARSVRALGAEVVVVGLLGGDTGRSIARRAAEERIAGRWVWTTAETRQCYCLLDRHTGALTEIYEPPRPVPTGDWPGYRETFAETVRCGNAADVVVLSGRLPAGLPSHALADLTTIAVEHGRRVLVDSDGPPLAEVLAAGPTIVKINRAEAERLTGTRPGLATGDQLAERVLELGAHAAIVTAGPAGSDYRDERGAACQVRNSPLPGAIPVGSGDAYLAGLAVSLLAGTGRQDALRLAGAAARANALALTAGTFTEAQVRAALDDVLVEPRRP